MKIPNFTTKLFIVIAALLLASNTFAQINHWETAVYGDDTWNYFIGTSAPGAGWQDTTFNDSSWSTGQGGFGYGDGDDNTNIGTSAEVVFVRINFNIVDTAVIKRAVFNMDYDDGFVAYLNGTEIARGNIGTSGIVPTYTDRASGNHEAVLYNGGNPESFILNKGVLNSVLKNGTNLLSVQVHNVNNTSSDLSCIPYLSFGITDASSDYRATPSWFVAPFTFSSNLPIVTINTNNQAIPDEPKIFGELGIIYNGPGQLNHLDDSPTEYAGDIMIEQRGETSQGFDKKSWSFKLIDSAGADMDAAFLNFPEEEDFILYGPYSDKTFLRNVLTMKIGREMGAYHSRTRVVEVVLNDDYRGVYVLMERLKRDKNRLDLPKLKTTDISGMQLTGGYIFRTDKGTHDGWNSQYNVPATGNKMYFQYFYPKEADITPEQKGYIKSYVDSFEQALKAPNFIGAYGHRYNEYIEFRSFFDFFIINEVANNIDGYRLSTYYHKNKDTKDGLLHAGPFWDFNLSFGNGDYCEGDVTNKWQYLGCGQEGTFWWEEFITDTMYTRGLKCRWDELRATALNTNYLMSYIDSIQAVIDSAAATRNYDLYPVLGTRVWPNPPPYYNTYGEEVDDMQNWLTNRLAWLDANMPGIAANCDDFIPCWVKKNRFSITACDSYTVPSGDETYTTAGIYTVKDTLTSSCGVDSLLTIDITLNLSAATTDVITSCGPYKWKDSITYTANNNTATYNDTTIAGCDSVISLNLTIDTVKTRTNTVSTCNPYTWTNGITYTTSNNTAKDTIGNPSGCDSIISLDLTINNANTRTDTITACESYTWIDGNTYTANNTTATHTLTNIGGCDSVVTLALTLNYEDAGIDTITVCDPYTWIDGVTYNASNNTATHIISNPGGCDSVITLGLTVNTINAGNDVITACESYTWIDGITYTASTNSAVHILPNAGGCDSAITLYLTINNARTGINTINTCQAFTWIDGNTYSTDNNTATFTTSTVGGCDSVVTLNLTIQNISAGADVVEACESYTWIDGNTYTESNNTASYVITSPTGCDSAITLNLTINRPNTDVTVTGNSLIANENGATYQWLNCNDGHIELDGVNSQIHTTFVNGTFAVEVTKNTCTDTSDCVVFSGVNIEERTMLSSISIAPNPTTGFVNINLGLLQYIDVKVYSMYGQVVYQKENIRNASLPFEINGAAGIYFIEVRSLDEMRKFKVVKQ